MEHVDADFLSTLEMKKKHHLVVMSIKTKLTVRYIRSYYITIEI